MKVLFMALWLVGACITGAGLYGIAYEVESMEGELAALAEDIRKERETTRGLNAEWAYLARPARIEELSRTYLPQLRNLSVNRIGTTGDLPYMPLPDVLDVLEPGDLAKPASARITQ